MALINCHKCGNEISDKAAYCSHCGYPVQLKIVPKKFCGYCGAEVDSCSNFCDQCGRSINKNSETNVTSELGEIKENIQETNIDKTNRQKLYVITVKGYKCDKNNAIYALSTETYTKFGNQELAAKLDAGSPFAVSAYKKRDIAETIASRLRDFYHISCVVEEKNSKAKVNDNNGVNNSYGASQGQTAPSNENTEPEVVMCPRCGKKELLDNIVKCPNCGYLIKTHFDYMKKRKIEIPNEIKMPEEPDYTLVLLGALFILGMTILFCLEIAEQTELFETVGEFGGSFVITSLVATILFFPGYFIWASYKRKKDDYRLASEDFEAYKKIKYDRELKKSEEFIKKTISERYGLQRK